MQVGDTIAVVTGDTYTHRAALAEGGWVWNKSALHHGTKKDGSPRGAWVAPLAIGATSIDGLGELAVVADASDVAAWQARNAPVPAEPATVTPDGEGTGPVRVDVKAWTLREVIAVLRYLRDGSIGYDTARRKKHEMEADLLASFDDGQLLAGYEAVRGAQAPVAAVRPTTTSARTTPAPANAGATGGPGLAPGGVEQAIAALVESLAGSQVAALDEARVREIAHEEATGMLEHVARTIEDAVKGVAPREIMLRGPQGPLGEAVAGAHPMLEKVARLVDVGVNVALAGPAGAGKTHLCEQLAVLRGQAFASLSLTAGTTESALLGRLLPVGEGGRFEYVASPFARVYDADGDGGVFLFDEMDAADANMLLITNTATTNGHIEIEARGASNLPTRVERHPKSVLVAAMNTHGTGATSQYVGRGALDAATMDRWYVVEMTYDAGFEASLFGGTAPAAKAWVAASMDETDVRRECKALGEWVLDVRRKATAAGLRRIVSTRMIQKAVAARQAGVPVDEIKADLLAGWSADELRAVR